MFRSKKIWWTTAVLLISLYIPAKGHAAGGRDEYKYTAITGIVDFRYGKSRQTNKSSSTDNTTFNQNYSLNISGNLLNRLLINYNAGLRYGKQSLDYGTLRSESDVRAYNLKVILLPSSMIPLTLYNHKAISGDSRTNNYGLNWSGKFRKIPKTNITVDRTDTGVGDSKQQDTYYTLNMIKSLGSSRNQFDYSQSERVDKTSSEGSSTAAMNFTNQTRISRSTSIDLSAARGVSKGDDIAETTIEGLRANLTSSPGKGLRQSHSYYYSKNKRESYLGTSQSYNGSINYGFSESLTSHMRMSVSNREAYSLTADTTTDTTTMSGGLSYRASRKLSLSESVSYTTTEFSGSGSGQSNLSDQTILKVSTNANYNTRLNWAKMAAGYSIGYLEESHSSSRTGNQEEEGSALDQAISLSLGDMDAMGYATVEASGKYSYLEALKGDITGRDLSLSIYATNRVWKKHVRLTASYERKDNKPWLSAETQKSDILAFTGETLYLTKYLNPTGNGRTVLRFRGNRRSSSNNFDDKSIDTSKHIGINHDRILLRGQLTGFIRYTNTQAEYTGGTQDITDSELGADYERALFRRISWKAKALRKSTTASGYETVSTSISNKFKYTLRNWSFGTAHEYRILRYSNSKAYANRIMLTASRRFVRIL